jgi:predicted nucleic acid-binding protein
VDRLFLDANVLFSAAYQQSSTLRRLWALGDVELLTSTYAAAEARRNLQLKKPGALPELIDLLSHVGLISNVDCVALEEAERLPIKDRPILSAAAMVGATHLLTGDQRHFGPLFGQQIAGVLILPPGEYLKRRSKA